MGCPLSCSSISKYVALKMHVNKLIIQEAVTLIYLWTQSAIQSIQMRDMWSFYWHLSPSIGREETVKVSDRERQINGPPADSTSRLSHHDLQQTQFDGLCL